MDHGDHWRALHSSEEYVFETLLPSLARNGQVVGETLGDVVDEAGAVARKRIVLFDWPKTPLRYLMIVSFSPEDRSAGGEMEVAFPYCAEGIASEMEIDAVSAMEGCPLEGYVVAHAAGRVLLDLYDPLFALRHERYRAGTTAQISLAGLALRLRKAEPKAIEVQEGGLLDLTRSRRLEEDPDFDVSTITSVPLHIPRGATWLFPVEDCRGWSQVRATVEEVDRFDLDDVQVDRLRVFLGRDAEHQGDVPAYIYLAPGALDGDPPLVGDDVEGVVWMQGTLVEADAVAIEETILSETGDRS